MNENALFGEATFQSLFGNLFQGNFFRRDFAKRQECRFPKTRGRRAAKFRPSEIARRGNEDRNVFAPKNVSLPGKRLSCRFSETFFKEISFGGISPSDRNVASPKAR